MIINGLDTHAFYSINCRYSNVQMIFVILMFDDFIIYKANDFFVCVYFSDPRTKDWPMMSSPFPTLAVCLSYVYIVKVSNEYKIKIIIIIIIIIIIVIIYIDIYNE